MLDLSEENFRESVASSSSWRSCAVARLAPDVATRIDVAAKAVPLGPPYVLGEDFHRAVLARLGDDPTVAALYRLGVDFDEAVDRDVERAIEAELPERFILDDDYPDFVDELPASAFVEARKVFDEIARLVQAAG
jgi:hypothetical protein